MGFAWASRDRLCPMRMVDNLGHNYHCFEIARFKKRRRLRSYSGFLQAHRGRVEYKRWAHTVAAGRLGEWPRYRGKFKPKVRVPL